MRTALYVLTVLLLGIFLAMLRAAPRKQSKTSSPSRSVRHPELEYLKAVNAVGPPKDPQLLLLVADGKYELAASLLESSEGRFPGNQSLVRAKRLVYLKLMEKNQNMDPLKFIIYSGKIGEQLPPITTATA